VGPARVSNNPWQASVSACVLVRLFFDTPHSPGLLKGAQAVFSDLHRPDQGLVHAHTFGGEVQDVSIRSGTRRRRAAMVPLLLLLLLALSRDLLPGTDHPRSSLFIPL
jgi:hypothetical protein